MLYVSLGLRLLLHLSLLTSRPLSNTEFVRQPGKYGETLEGKNERKEERKEGRERGREGGREGKGKKERMEGRRIGRKKEEIIFYSVCNFCKETKN